MNRNRKKKNDIIFANFAKEKMKSARNDGRQGRRKEEEKGEIRDGEMTYGSYGEPDSCTMNMCSYQKRSDQKGINNNAYSSGFGNSTQSSIEVLHDPYGKYVNSSDCGDQRSRRIEKRNNMTCFLKREGSGTRNARITKPSSDMWEDCGVGGELQTDEYLEVDKINNITFGNDECLDTDFIYANSSFIEDEKKLFRLTNQNNTCRSYKDNAMTVGITSNMTQSRWIEELGGKDMQRENKEKRLFETSAPFYQGDSLSHTNNNNINNNNNNNYYYNNNNNNNQKHSVGTTGIVPNGELLSKNNVNCLHQKSNLESCERVEFTEMRPPHFSFLNDKNISNANHNTGSPMEELEFLYHLKNAKKWMSDEAVQIQNKRGTFLQREKREGENSYLEMNDKEISDWERRTHVHNAAHRFLKQSGLNIPAGYESRNDVSFVTHGLPNRDKDIEGVEETKEGEEERVREEEPSFIAAEESKRIALILRNNDTQDYRMHDNSLNEVRDVMYQHTPNDTIVSQDRVLENSIENVHNIQKQQFFHNQQELSKRNQKMDESAFSRLQSRESVHNDYVLNDPLLNQLNNMYSINKLRNIYEENRRDAIEEKKYMTNQMREGAMHKESDVFRNMNGTNLSAENEMPRDYVMTDENRELWKRKMAEMNSEDFLKEAHCSLKEGINVYNHEDILSQHDNRKYSAGVVQMTEEEKNYLLLELMRKRMNEDFAPSKRGCPPPDIRDNVNLEMLKNPMSANVDFIRNEETEASYFNKIHDMREKLESLRKDGNNIDDANFVMEEYHSRITPEQKVREEERTQNPVPPIRPLPPMPPLPPPSFEKETYNDNITFPGTATVIDHSRNKKSAPHYERNGIYIHNMKRVGDDSCEGNVEHEQMANLNHLRRENTRNERGEGRHKGNHVERPMNVDMEENYANDTGGVGVGESAMIEYIEEREKNKNRMRRKRNDCNVEKKHIVYSTNYSNEENAPNVEQIIDASNEQVGEHRTNRSDKEVEGKNEEDFVKRLKNSNMFKLTNFLKNHFKNMELEGLNNDMYNYYVFLNKVSADVKRHNYIYKYKGMMQASDKNKLLRIQLSYMVVNPAIQKHTGKWNFKIGEKDRDANATNKDENKNRFITEGEENNAIHMEKGHISVDGLVNGQRLCNSTEGNNDERIGQLKGTWNEDMSLTKAYSTEKLRNTHNNSDISEDAVFIASLKHYNSFLNEYFDNTLNKTGEYVSPYCSSYVKGNIEEEFFETNVNKLLSFSLAEEDPYNNTHPCEGCNEMVSQNKNTRQIGIREMGSGDNTLNGVNGDEEDSKLQNMEVNLICKYENIKKLGKHVFATIHEPRNLIRLVDNKELEDVNHLVEKIKIIVKKAMKKITNNAFISNGVYEFTKEENFTKEKDMARSAEVKRDSKKNVKKELKMHEHGSIKGKEVEDVSFGANEKLISDVTKKIVEYLWDCYLDIKHIFKDIDNCPYTHIETIAKYKEEIQKRKNNLLNFIFLNKNDSERVLSNSLFDKSSNLCFNKYISNVDIAFNKEMYIYWANTLQNYFSSRMELKRPCLLDLMKRLRYESVRDHDEFANTEKKQQRKCMDVETEQQKENETMKESETETETEKKTERGAQYYTNSTNVTGNHFNNIFFFNFPYANNLCYLGKFGLFGYTLPFNYKYNFFNFDMYNEYRYFCGKTKETSNAWEQWNNGKWSNSHNNNNCSNSSSSSSCDGKKIGTIVGNKCKGKNEEYHSKKQGWIASDRTNRINKTIPSIVHKSVEHVEVSEDVLKEEMSKLKSSCFLFVNCFVKKKGTMVYKKIFKIMKKNKRKILIYLIFKNYYLIYYILSNADACFEDDVEYEDFLRLQLLYVNANVNSLNKLLKDEKNENLRVIRNAVSNKKTPVLSIRHKLYNFNIYTSLYIYLMDITLSYLFTPDIGVSFIQNILSLLLFFNHVHLYITKIIQYTSGAAFLTVMIVKIIPYVKSFDRNVITCFLYSVLHSLFYILSNIYVHHFEIEREHFKGGSEELSTHILSLMESEMEFYKIMFKSICSYMQHDIFFKKEITEMLNDLGRDPVVDSLLSELQSG